jgi:hypothetical protein
MGILIVDDDRREAHTFAHTLGAMEYGVGLTHS